MRAALHIDCGGAGCEGCRGFGYVRIPQEWGFGLLVLHWCVITATSYDVAVAAAATSTADEVLQ
jgi:hypothetical protein